MYQIKFYLLIKNFETKTEAISPLEKAAFFRDKFVAMYPDMTAVRHTD